MRQTLGGIDAGGLEQSGTRRSDSIRFGPSAHGIERAEVYLSNCAFEPHRHDTYAIGINTAGGFGYRILYIPPELVRDALAGRALPFVADPIQQLVPAARLIASLLADIDEPINELSSAEIAVAVADGLVSLSGHPDRRKAAIDTRAVDLARDYLAAHAREQTSASILEKIAGTDRFTIARHFR